MDDREWLRSQGFSDVGQRGRLRPEWKAALANRPVGEAESDSEPLPDPKPIQVPEISASVSEDVTDPSRLCRGIRSYGSCGCIGYLKGNRSQMYTTCANCGCCEGTHYKD